MHVHPARERSVPDPGDLLHGFAQAAALTGPQALFAVDAAGVVTDCNPGVAQVLGHPRSELIGQPFADLFTGIPPESTFLQRWLAWDPAEPFRDAGWMLRRDGLRMWAEAGCVADPGPDGRPRRFWFSVRDATLHYRAGQAVRTQADAAAASAVSRNLFLGSIAHELRAVLAPIATSAVLLERQALEPARVERLVEIIGRNASTAVRLLEDLLTFSTASENKLLLRPEVVDLHRLLAACADAVRAQASTAGVELRLALCAPAAQALVRCDPVRIHQVVLNLLGNAIKFTPPGGSVVVETACSTEGFLVDVSDTGVGIDPAALPFVFDPFEQGGPEVTSRYGGFGLGLAICAAIARQHGGEVRASSAGLGQGSRFRLRLPRQDTLLGGSLRPAREPRALHVLYVEDDADAADAMRYALATLGWSMTHAASCAAARSVVERAGGSFDVMLADLGLPDGSGLELGTELSHRLPVVALTAYGAPHAMHAFANQLIKPAEIGEVQRALLAAHRSRAQALHD